MGRDLVTIEKDQPQAKDALSSVTFLDTCTWNLFLAFCCDASVNEKRKHSVRCKRMGKKKKIPCLVHTICSGAVVI